jgi:hypothetical protein
LKGNHEKQGIINPARLAVFELGRKPPARATARRVINAAKSVQKSDCRFPVTIEGAALTPARFDLRRRVRKLISLNGVVTKAASGSENIQGAVIAFACEAPALGTFTPAFSLLRFPCALIFRGL